jgi:hypothetical protein
MIDLRGSGLRGKRIHEDFNPGEGALNLADVMLVFSCGLMVALITFWQVEFPGSTQLENGKTLEEIRDAQTQQEQAQELPSGYKELGKVYEDPETGKLYMVVGEEAQEVGE